jgi:hypothetical protein
VRSYLQLLYKGYPLFLGALSSGGLFNRMTVFHRFRVGNNGKGYFSSCSFIEFYFESLSFGFND